MEPPLSYTTAMYVPVLVAAMMLYVGKFTMMSFILALVVIRES